MLLQCPLFVLDLSIIFCFVFNYTWNNNQDSGPVWSSESFHRISSSFYFIPCPWALSIPSEIIRKPKSEEILLFVGKNWDTLKLSHKEKHWIYLFIYSFMWSNNNNNKKNKNKQKKTTVKWYNLFKNIMSKPKFKT